MNDKIKIFYSHSVYKYDTQIEDMELRIIKKAFPNAEIINPHFEVNREKEEVDILKDCKDIIETCDALVFSTLSGVIGIGCLEEIQKAFSINLYVYELSDYNIYLIDDFDCDLLDTDIRREYAIIKTKKVKPLLSNSGYKFMPDGVHECDTRIYTHRQMFENVTVEILEDDYGHQSIGWYRQEDTNEITGLGDDYD